MAFGFADLPLWLCIVCFCAAATATWMAGTWLARYVNAISDKTSIGHAFSGMLLLGGITSSPELGAVLTSSFSGEAALAVNNLLGSLSINILLIAVADMYVRRSAITGIVAEPETLLYATLGILTLAILATAIVVGDRLVGGFGIWSCVIALAVLFSFWKASGYSGRAGWLADRSRDTPAQERSGPGDETKPSSGRVKSQLEARSLRSLIFRTAALALAVLIAGSVLSGTADAIADKAGIGTAFIGFLLISVATSLPELSTIISAVRLRRYEMAIGDVLGTNIFNLAILLAADLAFQGGPILNEAGRFELVATLLGMIMTAIYLIGLLERQDRTVRGVGYDSLAVLGTYLAGLGLLYIVR